MKKFLLFLILFSGTLSSFSQICNPASSCSNPSCPDTAQVMNARSNQSFSQTITLNIPSNFTDPTYGPIRVDSAVMTDFTNLPSGITWGTECGMVTSCTYTPGMHCLILTGTPTVVGTYTINLNSTTFVYVQNYSMATSRAGTAHYIISVSGLPNVTTTSASSVTSSSVITGGDVVSDSNSTVTARGIVYSTSQNPTLANGTNVTDANVGTGTFTSTLSPLNASTTYYVRAYATNANGTSYGNQVTFTSASTIPSLTTTSATSITMSSAVSGGNITSDGGAAVTVRGVVYSTSSNPTIGSGTNITDPNGGIGVFTSSLTSLSANTTYYVRAFATNTVGTGYGNQIIVTTLSPPLPPVMSSVTTTVTTYNTTKANVSGGGVTNTNGSAINASGIIYSTSQNPQLTSVGANSVANTSGNTNSIKATLTGLTPGTTYYVRTYATNATGTGYGTQVIYTSPSAILGCTPNPSISLATPGIFPKTVPHMDTANLNFFQTFTYSLPHSYKNEHGYNVDVDSSILTNVLNLPEGLNLHCGRPNADSCIFYPDEIGCFTISGTLPSINDVTYALEFVLNDYGIIHNYVANNGLQAGDQYLQQRIFSGYNADTVYIVVGNGPLLSIETNYSDMFDILESNPNPFNDAVSIKFTTTQSEKVIFTVTDLYGRELYNNIINATLGINTIDYSANGLVSGTYYFSISNGNRKVTKMMIAIK